MRKRNLKSKRWLHFCVKDIFPKIKRGKRLIKRHQIDGTIPYVSSRATNNGIDNFIGNKVGIRLFSNCMTIANGGNVGSSFFHPYRFVGCDDITQLKNLKFSREEYFFLTVQMKKIGKKYNFHLKLNEKRLLREKIMLPVDKRNNPDYSFCSVFIQELLQKKKRKIEIIFKKKLQSIKYKKIIKLCEKKWKSFLITDIAKIFSGKYIHEYDRIPGPTPYASDTGRNNGISFFVKNTNSTLESNCLSVNSTGSIRMTGCAFFHPYKTLFSRHCRKLRLKNQTAFVGYFVAHQVMQQKDKYNYLYTMGTARLQKQKIMLPTTVDDKPDYEYMSQYIQNVIQEKIQKYFSFCEKKSA